MTEELAVADAPKPHQYGDDIIEPGEPFTDATLVTIRALLAESDPVPEPKPIGASLPFGLGRPKPADAMATEGSLKTHLRETGTADNSTASAEDLASYYEEPPRTRSWRKIQVVEGTTGRNLRRFLMSPRLVSVIFLCGVVAWQPWFIPILALMFISVLLLIGALIGQDRMARIVLYCLKRFVWADPSLGRLLQRVLPYRWHGVLYRPATEEDVWDGPIDPSFEARIARLRS
ncbi:hypothetical protein NBRC116594_12740 [Shimia sp. NS0008-38b]|uniref:hypothetical protein n=1 Tax=Shimia sp. NS0008-38b TaxID=3127653 RepID=UPI00310716C9